MGVVNVPLIYFSVRWWNTLHQGASITTQGASMATPMLAGLLLMNPGVLGLCLCGSVRPRAGDGCSSCPRRRPTRMNTASLTDLLHLGGHGLYVWSAYAATLA